MSRILYHCTLPMLKNGWSFIANSLFSKRKIKFFFNFSKTNTMRANDCLIVNEKLPKGDNSIVSDEVLLFISKCCISHADWSAVVIIAENKFICFAFVFYVIVFRLILIHWTLFPLFQNSFWFDLTWRLTDLLNGWIIEPGEHWTWWLMTAYTVYRSGHWHLRRAFGIRTHTILFRIPTFQSKMPTHLNNMRK